MKRNKTVIYSFNDKQIGELNKILYMLKLYWKDLPEKEKEFLAQKKPPIKLNDDVNNPLQAFNNWLIRNDYDDSVAVKVNYYIHKFYKKAIGRAHV